MAIVEELRADRLYDPGEWLIEHRCEMDRGEAEWLETLAGFDRDHLWAVDGHMSCVVWLQWRTGMARATAFEKLRIAHELGRRPLVQQAFVEGHISYSAVRTITRLERPSEELDQALIDLAASGSITLLERAVRYHRLLSEQERPPDDAWERRGIRMATHGDGIGTLEATLTDVELAEFRSIHQAFIDRSAVGSPVDESPAGDSSAASPWPQRRADALMEMARLAMAHIHEGQAAGADRYMVHIVRREGGGSELVDGTPLHPSEAERIACDASVVQHTHSEQGEPLSLGRRTRDWSTAQRRAILVRDRGTCRFPGCDRTLVDIHHVHHWESGGATDISNGMLACTFHHSLLHRGFSAAGDANSNLLFYRRDGSSLGSS